MGKRVKVALLIAVIAAISLWAVVAQAQTPPMTPQELAKYVQNLKSEPTLQEIFNMLGYGYINVATDESGLELFPTISGEYHQKLCVEYAGYGPYTSSGWYVAGSPNDTTRLFSGRALLSPSVSCRCPCRLAGDVGLYVCIAIASFFQCKT